MQGSHRTKIICLCCAVALVLQGCASSADTAVPQPTQSVDGSETQTVAWPKEKLETGENGAPVLDVYVTEEKAVRRMDVETYVQGVLAGEMKNDWPMEALKAQAILARTFVLKFVDEKKSRQENADISTDIEEAQAYDAKAVNDRVRQAVEETRGMVLASDGRLIYAWFHAHSGGVTEKAVAGLGWDRSEPPYTRTAEGNEPEMAEKEKDDQVLRAGKEWKASFSAPAFAAACEKQGVKVRVDAQTRLEITERGESGRAVTLSVGGQPVKAAELRMALGSTKMRSTLLTSLTVDGDGVHMAGKGYGHGVGMSQWGAYGMALEGKTAAEIVTHYFQNVQVETLW